MSHITIRALLFILFLIIGARPEGTHPDSGFKSIHQLNDETHRRDTIQHDSDVRNEPVNVENMHVSDRQAETFTNLTLFNILLTILLIVFVLFLLLHRRYRWKKE